MKTYSETRGKIPFDWNEALSNPFGLATVETYNRINCLSMLASHWVTCACGNQCDIIPRTDGKPDDEILAGLGIDFSEAILDLKTEANVSLESEIIDDIYRLKAIEILKEIEARSTELINAIQ